MKQFIFATNYGTEPGQVSFESATEYYFSNNPSYEVDLKWPGINLVYHREAKDGGNVTFPISSNNFNYTVTKYLPDTKFSADIILKPLNRLGDYTVIICKKGVKFNERNKWTATVHIINPDTEINDFANSLVKAINNIIGHDCTAKYDEDNNKIIIDGNNSGENYAIVLADNMYGWTVNVTSSGFKGICTPNYIKDLADKCAADVGFDYTYVDANAYMYHNYPFSFNIENLSSDDSANKYTIYNISFSESRDVKTRDEVIKQMIHVVFPSYDSYDNEGKASFMNFYNILEALHKKEIVYLDSDRKIINTESSELATMNLDKEDFPKNNTEPTKSEPVVINFENTENLENTETVEKTESADVPLDQSDKDVPLEQIDDEVTNEQTVQTEESDKKDIELV